MRALGISSGTSHDGIDAVVVDFRLDGTALVGTVLASSATPYDARLRDRLVDLLPPRATTIGEVAELDALIGQAFADAAARLAETVGGVDLVCSHGQTVFHWVDGAGHALGTLQLGQPAWIAERTGVPVVSDVRIRDIAAGGQGAPLVALLDGLLLAGHPQRAALLNLGGIANVTIVDPDAAPLAYDIGPANALIDAVVRSRGLHPRGFDEDGVIAATGRVDDGLLEALLADPYFDRPAPKSTGKERFNLDYVLTAVGGDGIAASDLVRTLTELTARSVARDLERHRLDALWVSGGGCRNPVLMGRLRELLPEVRIALSDELGAPADDKEAILFALIGWCTISGVPASVPSVTGAAGSRVLGTITPGLTPLRLPEPVPAPSSLRLRGPA